MNEELKSVLMIATPIAGVGFVSIFWYATQHYWKNRKRIRELEKKLSKEIKGGYSGLIKRRATQDDLDTIEEIIDLKSHIFEPQPSDVADVPATGPQLAYIKSLGGRPRRSMTFVEASNEIDRLKNKRMRRG